jgi:Mn-dependent DtxR family transcriptional regulator
MTGGSSSVTHLADILNVNKSTISRAVDWYESQGMIQREGERSLVLTAHGREIADEYDKRIRASMDWLLSNGIAPDIAKEDAMKLAVSVSEQASSVIERTMLRKFVKQQLGNAERFSGDQFCSVVGDGVYPIDFVFYRCACGNRDDMCCLSPSMANSGFCRPGKIEIKGKTGRIILEAIMCAHQSAATKEKMEGMLMSMQYKDGSSYREAGREGNQFHFPVTAMDFINPAPDSVIQGNAVLQMSCSVGTEHMPESRSVITVTF